MPGSERLFNQAEGRTKRYVCKLKPDTGRWDALLNVRVRDSWNRTRKVGVFNACLQFKPTSSLGNYEWTKHSVLGLLQGNELLSRVLARDLHGRLTGGTTGSLHPRKTLGNLVQPGRELGEATGQAPGVYLLPKWWVWFFPVENIWRVAEFLSQVRIVLICFVWTWCWCCLTFLFLEQPERQKCSVSSTVWSRSESAFKNNT